MDNNIIVYTAVFGNYDVVLEPEVIPDDVDFVCITDNPDIARGVWEPLVISDDNLSPKLRSGKAKVLAHEFFPNYEYSVWIDGNMHITGDIREVIENNLKEKNMAVPDHKDRDCIYEEAHACMESGKAESEEIIHQMNRYREEGFPENFGLSETRILIRRHNESDVIDTMEKWWDEYQKGAERDQLSFEYAAWKLNFDYEHLDIDYYKGGPCFNLYPHKPMGLLEEIWEFLLIGYNNNSGIMKMIYVMIFLLVKYPVICWRIQQRQGFIYLIETSMNKLKWF